MATVNTSVDKVSAGGSSRVHVGNIIYPSEDTCLRALHITDPQLDKTRIEAEKGGLLDNVYRWVLCSPEYRQWRDGGERLLWVRGDPGKGKTMLLCGIINELEQHGSLVSYFFCQATDDRINSATAVLRGLIYMLIDRRPSLVSHVRKRYDHAGSRLFEGANAWVAVCDIFVDILRDPVLEAPCLIVDALDECQIGRSALLDFIVSLSSTYAAKWIISSRNWPEIDKKLRKARQKIPLSLELNAKSVSAAVQLYILRRTQELAEENEYDVTTTAKVTSYLSSNARDTFLWVALVCRALQEAHRFNALNILYGFPAGLDALYARMMQRIGSMADTIDVKLCIQILAVTSAVYRPLTLEELASFIDCPFDTPHDNSWLEHYVKLCGSFLAIRERAVYFIHQSAKDFLCNPILNGEYPQMFPAAIKGLHHALFVKSLEATSAALQRDLYSLQDPGIVIEHIAPPAIDPLAPIRYSCLYWVDHLTASVSSTPPISLDRSLDVSDLQDNDLVYRFLYNKYLYWLEALGLLGSIPEGIVAISKLTTLLVSSFAV